jgi:adenylate cyclase
MWLTLQEGRQSAMASAEQQMRLLSRATTALYDSVFRDGYSVVVQGAVLPSLTAPLPSYVDAKREYLLRALRGSPHLDAVYVGYPNGSYFQIMRAERSGNWRQAVDAPADAAYGMRVVTRAPGGSSYARWYFLNEDGRRIGAGILRPVDFDPRRRPWYREAVRSTEPGATGPYVSASTGALTITLAAGMTGDRGTVIGADVMLETISHLLDEQAVSDSAVGYVFDADGRLIVHSNPVRMAELVDRLSARSAGNRMVASSDETDLAEIAGSMVARSRTDDLRPEDDPILSSIERMLAQVPASAQGQLVDFQIEKKPWLAHVASIDVGEAHLLSGYRVVIAAPVEDFTAASVELLRKKLAIAAVVVIAGVLLALVVSRRISRALVALASDAEQIGNLDFDGRSAPRSLISEINMLSRAMSSARKAIRNFALYVPRELVRQIVATGQDATGAAMRREVTVLFTDIRDFTTISEQHSPEDVVDMLGAYFQTMNDIVERHNGVIVQYLGDSIYAMWNAPAANPDHVQDGCRCALALSAAVDRLNADNLRAGRPELVTRFGLHTGVAVVGSVGAEDRRQYTAMGDTVNVASRLEGMNKQFGTTILASAAVRDRAGDVVGFRPLGAASAKGRREQIQIFELVPPAAAS